MEPHERKKLKKIKAVSDSEEEEEGLCSLYDSSHLLHWKLLLLLFLQTMRTKYARNLKISSMIDRLMTKVTVIQMVRDPMRSVKSRMMMMMS